MTYFAEIEKALMKFMWKNKGPEIVKEIDQPQQQKQTNTKAKQKA